MLKRKQKNGQGSHRQNSVYRYICWFALLVAGLLIAESSAWALNGSRSAYRDVFSREDIHIESGQVIGRLLVAGGNATVSGVVEKGIVVVDGNLLLTPGAHIKGSVGVLGGYVNRDSAARVEKLMLAVAPGPRPVADFLVLGFLFLGIASLVVFPILVLLLARIVRSSSPYLWMREQLLLLRRDWSIFYIAFALSLGTLLFVFFAEMAYETLIRNQMDLFDNVFVWLVRYMARPELDQIMIMISEFGYGYPFWTIIIAVLIILAYYRQWLEIAGLIVCLVGEAVLNFFLKNLFARTRPDLFQVVAEAGYSFPSGHAMVSLCLYGMLTFLIARHVQSWRWRLVVIGLAMALVVAIGVSRVYLGVHYPTDVVAGYFAGGMWLAFCISLLLWWPRR